MGLTVSCQTALNLNLRPSKKVIFYRQLSKMQSNTVLTVKTFQGISNLTLSADLHRLLAPEESLHLKNHGPCCQKHSL